MDDVKKVLSHAATLLRLGWCQHADAQNDQTAPVSCVSPKAASWSIVGAVRNACFMFRPESKSFGNHELFVRATVAIKNVLNLHDAGLHQLSQWNDSPGRTVQNVTDAIDRAGELC